MSTDESRTVGLVADPGIAATMAGRVAGALEARLSEAVGGRWRAEVDERRLPLDSCGDVPFFSSARRIREETGWDWVVYVTELPRFLEDGPMLAEADGEECAGMLSLPAFGAVGVRRRLLRAAVHMIRETEGGGGSSPPRLWSGRPGARLRRRVDSGERTVECLHRAGPLRLLPAVLGTIRTNRPLDLVAALSNSLALAAATGAFGIFYGSIWTMSDALSPARLTVISAAVIVLLVVWLIVRNGLWDSPRGLAGRREAWMSNAATLLTLATGVLVMHLALLLVMVALGGTVIEPGYLESQLGHPVGPGDYAQLAWLSASLGTLAGALGSNFNSEEAVREATYSRRVYERRRLAREMEEDADGE
jgi:hypothetical protein